MADVTDKKRLRQVQQQDLTESRLNDDFVFWLKTKGWNYGLILLLILCGYSFLNLYWQKQEEGRNNAWSEFTAAQISGLPESFALVAEQYGSTDSVAILAWLQAGDAHLRDLQVGQVAPAIATGPDGTPNPPEALTDETRKLAQDAADGFYMKAMQALAPRRNEQAVRPLVLSALFGSAAVAESRGDFERAKSLLTEAETLAGEQLPAFSAEAKRRIESLDRLASAAPLPLRASLPARPDQAPLAPNVMDELQKSLTVPPPTPPAEQPAQPAATPSQPPPSTGTTPPTGG